ncbi:hypothetical protein ACQKPE_22340 [Pseudomonas sp. NPDC089554]|uniref:hypothetical protein n=1 Tax=Pseudomonas sp. NPDC089554 TaxID=3390653 RepID=UPI003D02D00C
MAERQQHFPYTPPNATALESLLSSKRFATYLKAAGFRADFAFELYLYNARLCKAFLFPLHVVEVTLRNAIDDVLSSLHGASWHSAATLPPVLSPESLASLQKAISRATKNGVARKDDVISCLTFDFWSNLFRSHYDRSIWQTNMGRLLPCAPGMTRSQFKPLVMEINQLRNRIAHHEPIFAQDVSRLYRSILDTVAFRCPIAANWLKSHATLNKTIRTRPASGAGQGPCVSTICDDDFSVIDAESTLAKLSGMKSRFMVCTRSEDLVGVLDHSDIGKYLISQIDDCALLDLNEHTLNDVLTAANGFAAFASLGPPHGTQALQNLFKGPIRFALVKDQQDVLKGVVARAHRKY